MIALITFADPLRLADGRIVRRQRFASATVLPLDAVCAVATAIGERISALFACQAALEVIEPISLEPAAREDLLADAHVLRIRGGTVDAFVIIRRRDARRFADCAFAHDLATPRSALSSLELRVVERLSKAVAQACVPLCGHAATVAQEPAQLAARDAAIYFELRLGEPVRAAIGVALSGDPSHKRKRPIQPDALYNVRIAVRALVGRGTIRLADAAALRLGTVVPLDTPLDGAASLQASHRVIASGECGVVGTILAFRVAEPFGAGT